METYEEFVGTWQGQPSLAYSTNKGTPRHFILPKSGSVNPSSWLFLASNATASAAAV
jgi:hypothetical protein